VIVLADFTAGVGLRYSGFRGVKHLAASIKSPQLPVAGRPDNRAHAVPCGDDDDAPFLPLVSSKLLGLAADQPALLTRAAPACDWNEWLGAMADNGDVMP
jgi:hypothetical protein